MGMLKEQSIPALYQGVSQQPATVRYPSQVESARNVQFSVESGGFTKRQGTTLLGSPGSFGTSTGSDYRLHKVQSEGGTYVLVHGGSDLKTFDLTTGQVGGVTAENPDDDFYLDLDPSNYEFLTVLDTTFVLRKDIKVKMLAPPQPPYIKTGSIQLTRGITNGTYKVRIKYKQGSTVKHLVGSHTFTTNDKAPHQILDEIEPNLRTALDADTNSWELIRDGSYFHIKSLSGKSFTIECTDPHGDQAFIATTETIDNASKLVARTWNGARVEIKKSSEEEGYCLEFKTDEGEDYGKGQWDEAVPHGTLAEFDPTTMPRVLKRQPDGSLRLERIEWAHKKAGGELLVPLPDFVGRKIKDIVFTRNRLGFVFDESVYFSAAGDFFRFWPQTAQQLLPEDPFGLTNTTTSSVGFMTGTEFRRSLYLMSEGAQFEVFGSPFAASHAAIQPATQYPAYANVRPAVIGDELYFLSKASHRVGLYAYRYSEASTSEIATDVSKHVPSLMAGTPRRLIGNPLASELYVLTDGNKSKLYVHGFYYSGDERVQSSWAYYDFGVRDILDAVVEGDALILLTERGGQLFLESLDTSDKADSYFDYQPRLDRRQFVRGTFDASRRVTTFSVVGIDADMIAVTTKKWPSGLKSIQVPLRRVADDTYEADGSWDQQDVVFGERFFSEVYLSPIFVRDERDQPITSGRLQLRRMSLTYAKTGHFKVGVKPEGREEKVYTFEPRTVSGEVVEVGSVPIKDGTFGFLAQTRADTCKIRVSSDSHLPMTITAATWAGFFNELTRQG